MPVNPAPQGTAAPQRASWHRWLVWALVAGLALLMGASALTVLALHHSTASRTLLNALPGVTVVAPEGALLGSFSAQRVDVRLPRGGRLSLIQPRWEGLSLQWDPGVAWQVALHADRVQVRQLQLDWVGDPHAPPLTAQHDLDLPLAITVEQLQVDEAISPSWASMPLHLVRGRLALQASNTDGPGRRHAVALQQLSWAGWRAQGQAGVQAHGGLQLHSEWVLQQEAGTLTGLQVAVSGQGPLARLAWQVRVSPVAPAFAMPTAVLLQADGQVQPFEAWPLSAAHVQTQGLDLSTLWAGLPRTALTGKLDLQTQRNGSIDADLSWRNEQAGAWDAQRVPVQAINGHVQLPALAQASQDASAWVHWLQAAQWDVRATTPSLGGAAVGSVTLKGAWLHPKHEALQAQLKEVALQALDGRAPPLRVSGRAVLQVHPSGAASVANPEAASLQVPQADWDLALSGQLDAGASASSRTRWRGLSAQAASLMSQGTLSTSDLKVSSLTLASGDEQLLLRDADFQWAPHEPWRARGQLQFTQLDPLRWWPAQGTSPGHSQISGLARLDVNQLGRGELHAELTLSSLLGLPVSGRLDWTAPALQDQARLSLQADAAGNHLAAQGSWAVCASAGLSGPIWSAHMAQQWTLAVQAPALSRLQALAPSLGLRQLTGEVSGRAQWQGKASAFVSSGDLQVQQLAWQTPSASLDSKTEASSPASTATMTQLKQGQLHWQLDSQSAQSPWQADLSLSGFRQGLAVVDQATARVQGSRAAHQWQLMADLGWRPALDRKERTEQAGREPSKVDATPSSRSLRLDWQAQGAWQEGETAWRGRVNTLKLSNRAVTPMTWLDAEPFDVAWARTPLAQTVSLSPTRLNLMGAQVLLQHADARWPHDGDAALGDIDLRMRLEPLALPALLSQWQSQAGWGGDLVVAGEASVQHRPHQAWVVDAQVARQSGDISLSEPTIEGNSQQPLGLRQARLSLHARDGVWRMEQAMEGQVLGRLSGHQEVMVASPQSLPSARDLLSGELDVQIATLRPWGSWIPAGWRLGGQLSAQAKLSGTLGRPQYTGEVRGSKLSLGQALLGVNLSDGQLSLALQGTEARLTQLVFKDGAQGSLSVEGDAHLSDTPVAHLRVQAERFALLQRVDRRMRVSGQAQATLGADDIQVDGRVQVDDGLIDISRIEAPTVGEDVHVIHRDRPELPTDASPSGGLAKRKVSAAVSIDLGKQLRLRGRGIDTLLTGSLKLSTPNGRSALTGQVQATQGTFTAYGQKLVIERGQLSFTGPIENPRLDILAMRAQSAMASSIVSSSEVKVGVSITGTAQEPRVSLYSEPTLSETEKLSWLVLGRAPTGLGGADLGLLQTAAVALLAGDKASPTDKLIGFIGLDELSVKQVDGTVRDTVVNLGKQVSQFWYLGYERSLNATGGNWQLIYRLAQRLTLRLQTGESHSLDLIRSWRWD